MPYHVRISKKSNRSRTEVKLDLTEEQLRERFLQPYRAGNPITVNGRTIYCNDIERIRISFTEDNSRQLLPIVQERRRQSDRAVIGISDEWYVADLGRDVSDDFIRTPPGTQLMDINWKKILDIIHYLLTQNKTLVSIITILFIIAAIITISDNYNSKNEESNNLNILHKINIHNDRKILFEAEERKDDIWKYETTFNLSFDLWSENPSTLNIYFRNFSKLNNTVNKDYMYETSDYLNYEVFPEKNHIIYNIEPNDRKRNLLLKFYLNDFSISGKYVLVRFSPELNFYLGNVTLFINYTDLKYEKEINKTINVPVYWMNEVYN